jgi:hypothetical protein
MVCRHQRYVKTCTKCLRPLPLSSYAKRGSGLQARCRKCHAEYTRANYQSNKQAYKDRARRNAARYLSKTQELIVDYLTKNPCVDCGNQDLRVLQFDYRDPLLKRANVVDLMRRGSALSRIREEIALCDVRCANCHSIRTAEQFGTWRHAHVLALATNQ